MPAKMQQSVTKLDGKSRFNNELNLVRKLVTDGQMMHPRQRLARRLHGLFVSGCLDTIFSGDTISLP
jgi:hypothetical protein